MEKNIKNDCAVIKRVVKEKKYCQIENDLINNRDLSYKALGIITYILAKPDDWQVYISDLIRGKDGEKSVRSGIKELIELKYMQRYRVFDLDTGKVHHWETLVSEIPFEEDELISSVKEKYLKTPEGEIMTKKLRIKTFERSVPIVIDREVVLFSQKGEIEEKSLLSQKVEVENLLIENAGQLILSKTKNDLDTNTEDSSSRNDHELLSYFEDNICTLKKTTLPKFLSYVEKYDVEFIKAIIDYGAETNAATFSWFKTVIDKYIQSGITTADGVNKQIKEFTTSKTKKVTKIDDPIYDIYEDYSNIYDLSKAENISIVKEIIKKDVSEVSYNTWIKNLEIYKVDGNILVICPNTFTKDIISSRFAESMDIVLENIGVSGKIIYDISANYKM